MDEEFHNIKNVSFCDRESFNNAILLLTMIKSDYYYIVGFSRVDGVITVGFDFESEYHGVITEHITINFNSSDENIEISCEIKNFTENGVIIESDKSKGKFSVVNNKVVYLNKIKKDEVFPLGIKELNKNILLSKNEIIDFLEEQYKHYLS